MTLEQLHDPPANIRTRGITDGNRKEWKKSSQAQPFCDTCRKKRDQDICSTPRGKRAIGEESAHKLGLQTTELS